MAREADCRLCRHFIPVFLMSGKLREEALIWIAKNRPNAHLKGWCRKYNRPVTYFTGTCFSFSPKRRPGRCARLDEFM
ncbi:MAG: hypothetical protein DRO39_09435 [Thermoprotei archaeon]|nr:MAG: hypothetical protein DRO39_09435 [Thermoprotei archaeon]